MAKKTTKTVNNNAVNNNETRFVCPKCGAEFAIPEHTQVGLGIMPGKDSGLGTIELPLAEGQKKPSKAQQRIAALQKAGVNTSNLVAIELGGTLGETIGRIVDGVISVVKDDDPIFKGIIAQGTVPNRRLFRRFVMAQMFHMLISKGGVTDSINHMSYEYTWRMLVEELRVQVKLVVNDPENYAIRSQWFTKQLVLTMAMRYLNELLPEYIDSLQVRHCKGKEYKRIKGTDYFVVDIPNRIYKPLNTALSSIRKAKDAAQLYLATKKFYDSMITLTWNTPNDKAWCDAYKGAGAYYTMSNLIQFHDCRIITKEGKVLSEDDSLEYIRQASTVHCTGEGWCMMGILKKLLKDNGIDIKKKIAEWRKAKARK